MEKDKAMDVEQIVQLTGLTKTKVREYIKKVFPDKIKRGSKPVLKNAEIQMFFDTLDRAGLTPQKEEAATVKPTEQKKRKVAIVGYAPSSRMLAPYDDKEFEIWGVNELYKIAPRVDVLFEMHNRKWFRSKARNPKHLEWLQKSKIPIFTLEKMDDIPKSIRFPIEEVKKFLNPYEGYFTNSISYMIALAIMLNFDEIHIYGVDMATEEEYNSQRPSVEFYLGIAAGIYKATGKCFVYIPPECDLIKTAFQYGYDSDQMTSAKRKLNARKQELVARMNQHGQRALEEQRNSDIMRGALDNMTYVERCLLGTIGDEQDGKET